MQASVANFIQEIRMILQLLTEARTSKTVRLRVFLTSRHEIPIRHGFYQILDTERQDFVLHNISPSIVNHDISIFLQHNLNFTAGERSLGASWLGEQIVKRLVYNANGLFIWAATACRFVHEGKRFVAKRLDTILQGSGSAATAPEKHLDEIYTNVLDVPKDQTQPLRLHHPSFRDFLLDSDRCKDPKFWVDEKHWLPSLRP